VKLHSEAVKAGLQGKKTLDTPASAWAAPSPATLFVFDSPEFHDIPLPPEGQMETDPRILREISSIPSPLSDSAPAPMASRQDSPQAVAKPADLGRFEEMVRKLQRGTWLEFTLEDNTLLRAKLAWVSPLRGTYLFTNRLGERAVSINSGGLALKLRDGLARIVDNAALMDRAVGSLMDRFKKS
jgi:hypothetical protein